jgi:hypothetical protein
MEAVAAHEFTHYVDLVRRLRQSNVLSDERSTTLFEAAYSDSGRTVSPSLIFSEKSLVALVKRKFKDGLSDPSLNKKVEEKWVAKDLPVRSVSIDDNVVRLAMEKVASAKFDPALIQRISQIESKMKR